MKSSTSTMIFAMNLFGIVLSTRMFSSTVFAASMNAARAKYLSAAGSSFSRLLKTYFLFSEKLKAALITLAQMFDALRLPVNMMNSV